MLERQPFGGPLFVSFAQREHAIGGLLARAMRVELDYEEGPTPATERALDINSEAAALQTRRRKDAP